MKKEYASKEHSHLGLLILFLGLIVCILFINLIQDNQIDKLENQLNPQEEYCWEEEMVNVSVSCWLSEYKKGCVIYKNLTSNCDCVNLDKFNKTICSGVKE